MKFFQSILFRSQLRKGTHVSKWHLTVFPKMKVCDHFADDKEIVNYYLADLRAEFGGFRVRIKPNAT